MATELDDVDVALLMLLQQDADRTNVELAREVGLSAAATLHRVRRLKELGVIRIVAAQIDPALAGFPLQVYVHLSLANRTTRGAAAFEATLNEMPQVISADDVTGELDYLLVVVARDVADLEHVLAHLATRGAQRIITSLKLKEIKPRSPLPLRHVGRATGTGTGVGVTFSGTRRKRTSSGLPG